MQTIYLDISNKGVIPVIYAKQGDVGRKVEVILTNSGLPYEPEAGSAFSAWYSGASGVGNYTDIGEKSAFSVSGNKVTVELITQMLQNAGEGILCLVLSRANGDQIGLWNIRYICECVPGAGSEPAKDYYTAFSEAVAGLASLKGNATAARSASGEVISVSDSDHLPLNGLKIYGKTTQDGTPIPEEPIPLESVGKDGSVTVTVRGANMVDINNLTYSSANGGTMSVNGDVITGSSNKGWGQIESKNFPSVPGATMYLSCKGITGGNNAFIRCACVNAEGTSTNFGSQVKGAGKVAVTVPENAVQVKVRMYINGTSSELAELVEASFDSVMLSYMDVDYEPFKEETKFTVSTPNGLPGIPVSSSGNYTDENGQQWICDEIDFARGVYVQRIGTYTTGSTTQWYKNGGDSKYIGTNNIHLYFPIANIDITNQNVICSSFQFYKYTGIGNEEHLNTIYNITGQKNVVIDVDKTLAADYNAWVAYVADNPFTVQYVLATPIETPISAEEMAAYAALHTNKPNTTVYNDAGAWMEMKYYTSNAAVPVNIGGGASGKVLGIDEHGCVVPKTLAQIGAAPAGLASKTIRIASESELDNALTEEINTMVDGSVRFLVFAPTNTAIFDGAAVLCRVYRRSDSGYGTADFIGYSSYGPYVWYKSWFGGVWQPLEWNNPPMILGVEYRTTERWNGEVVYTARIYYGKGSSTGNFDIYTNSVTGLNVKFIDAVCKAEGAGGWSEFIGHPNLTFAESGSGSAMFAVRNKGDLSSHDIYLTVKYYKV